MNVSKGGYWPVRWSVVLGIACLHATLWAEQSFWDLAKLSEPPQTALVETTEPGVKALFYESVPWKGKPTQVFAYYGVPPHAEGAKLPAIVLVHGGQGSAYAEWVRLWNKRGYVAIAMDHFGNMPTVALPDAPYRIQRPRNPHGGPSGDGGFAQINEPVEDQWTYQGVATIILANSLLRSWPEVDPERIGLTGISWGGFLVSIAAGVDSRFRFAVPVYGCGFIGENPSWPPAFHSLSPDQAQKWSGLWDPSHFLRQAQMPMMWINSTNDIAFSLGEWQKSTDLPAGPQTRVIRVRLPHGQSEGASPPEIAAFANGVLGMGKPLATIGDIQKSGKETVSVNFQSSTGMKKAELIYTKDIGSWQNRQWDTIPAVLSGSTAKAKLPTGTRAYFINLTDERDLTVSSRYHVVE